MWWVVQNTSFNFTLLTILKTILSWLLHRTSIAKWRCWSAVGQKLWVECACQCLAAVRGVTTGSTLTSSTPWMTFVFAASVPPLLGHEALFWSLLNIFKKCLLCFAIHNILGAILSSVSMCIREYCMLITAAMTLVWRLDIETFHVWLPKCWNFTSAISGIFSFVCRSASD